MIVIQVMTILNSVNRFITIWDLFREKGPSAYYKKNVIKMALFLNCYNFRTVRAINFLLSALHTTPFLYGKVHFGVLKMLHASIAMSDTPRGSNSPFKSFQIPVAS